MKNITDILFSRKLTIILLIVIAFASGVATFIEQSYDTATAYALVYTAKWFELLLLITVINLTGVIFKQKLYKKAKLAALVFHAGFILMIVGAWVTRYIGYEGTMRIREGFSSNELFVDDGIYLRVSTSGLSQDYNFEKEIDVYNPEENIFTEKFETSDKGTIEVKLKQFIPYAKEQITESPNGDFYLEYMISNGRETSKIRMKEGEFRSINGTHVSFNKTLKSPVSLYFQNDSLKLKSNDKIIRTNIEGNPYDTIQAEIGINFSTDTVYFTNGKYLMPTKLYRAERRIVPGTRDDKMVSDVVIVEVSNGGNSQDFDVFGGRGYLGKYQDYDMGNLQMKIGFGTKVVTLPFSLHLNDFILERNPGSMSPSSYESKVTLIDESKGINEDHRIYMNNVLDYRGYRFFQSSYDQDEKGTVLSVSHDVLGTTITYISYLMLVIGFIMTFFMKKSRFRTLGRQIVKASKERKKTVSVILLIFALNSISFGQVQKPVSQEHAENFGHLMVQSLGRFQPLHTLAVDVIHKVTKKHSLTVPGKGKLSAIQIFLDMVVDVQFWTGQKIISVKDASLRSILGIEGKYASYNDFYTQEGNYKLASYIEQANMKGRPDRTSFDKEIIKVDERFNIVHSIFVSSMINIFPIQGHSNHKWVNFQDREAQAPITGGLAGLNEYFKLNVLNYAGIYKSYIQELKNAVNTGDYSQCDQIINYIDNIQRQLTPPHVLPSQSQIDLEVYYNDSQIFVKLKFIYMIISVFLLIFAFADHLSSRRNKWLKYSLNSFIVLLGLAFLYHTFGLILRWYLSGHAPWANGYEVLIFVSWGTILAGFGFLRYSKITLAASALLAFLILMVSGFSLYDPQISPLVPVLKSYWLIIHVAIIVISYSFLGLGFVLGLMNLFIYIFKNKENNQRLSKIIKDLSNINELNLLLGLILATIGTFLGGVWANESWGRYWGWDSKETWALIIMLAYAAILHFRLVPGLKGRLLFNAASVIGFWTVIFTFFGVNFYFTKGLHSYASGETTLFPTWVWIAVFGQIALIIAASLKDQQLKKTSEQKDESLP